MDDGLIPAASPRALRRRRSTRAFDEALAFYQAAMVAQANTLGEMAADLLRRRPHDVLEAAALLEAAVEVGAADPLLARSAVAEVAEWLRETFDPRARVSGRGARAANALRLIEAGRIAGLIGHPSAQQHLLDLELQTLPLFETIGTHREAVATLRDVVDSLRRDGAPATEVEDRRIRRLEEVAIWLEICPEPE